MQYVYNLPLERKKQQLKNQIPETPKPRVFFFLIRQNIKVKKNKTGISADPPRTR